MANDCSCDEEDTDQKQLNRIRTASQFSWMTDDVAENILGALRLARLQYLTPNILAIEYSSSDLGSHILSRGTESDKVTSYILTTQNERCKEWGPGPSTPQ